VDTASPFLAELPRFDNSQNVEMSIKVTVRRVCFGSGTPSGDRISRA